MTAEVNGNQALRDEYQDYLTIIEEKLSIPDEFDLKSVTNDLEQNGKGILLVRYVPEKINNDLFGEHFSVTIEKETKLILGFTHMDQKYTLSDDQKLLSKEETKRIAKQFLINLTQDILKHWRIYGLTNMMKQLFWKVMK
ncbi:hypothetical protein GQR36_08890 [Enterococcus termitis]